MSRFKLDEKTRELMLKHLVEESNLRIDDLFTEKGKEEYSLLLWDALANYDEQWLGEQFAVARRLRREHFRGEAELKKKALD